jgi:hypothetical protein
VRCRCLAVAFTCVSVWGDERDGLLLFNLIQRECRRGSAAGWHWQCQAGWRTAPSRRQLQQSAQGAVARGWPDRPSRQESQAEADPKPNSNPPAPLSPPDPRVTPPLSKECRREFLCHKFDRICRKYVQHLCFEINVIKTRFKYISNNINLVP